MSDLDEQSAPSLASPRQALAIALGVTVATALGMCFVFAPERAGSAAMLIALGVLYAVATALALLRLHRQGELRALFRPAGGDLTLGAATAGLLYGAARLVQHGLCPHGSVREAWILHLYLQIGDTEARGTELVAGAVFVVAALEEIAWRGLVMRSLEEAYGVRRALVFSSLLYGAAHLPTLLLLGDPSAGPNPLLVLAALGCGLCWGALYARTSRLLPAIFAHALFSWAVVEFPIWRP